MIDFATEKWAVAYPEMVPLLNLHWREIALGHDKVPLDVAYDDYQSLCERGRLHVFTARHAGRLVGYHVAIVAGHLHYASTLHAITDVYYILPEYRKGRTGLCLFRAYEAEMKQLGVVKLITGAKLHTAAGRSGKLFEYLGWKPTETVYTKLIGE